MADTNSQTDAVDTGLSAADTTSTVEDAEDIVASMDDIEVDLSESDEELQDEAATESEDTETDESNDDVTEEVETESEEVEDTPESEAERKRLNDENARRRIEEKRQRELQRQEQQAEFLQQAQDAQDLALRQLQVDAYQNKVDRISEKLETQLDRAVAEIDEFRTGSDEVKEELVNAVDEFEQMYVTRDKNGDPIEVRADLREFLQAKTERIRKLTNAGARNQVVAKSKTKAKTDPVPTRKPATPKIDPILAAFDEEVGK